MAETQAHSTIQREISLPNDIETIPQLCETIDSFAEESGLEMSLTMSLNLAIEEAVVNVMEYAYPKGTKGEVDVQMSSNGQEIVFILSDSGVAFDPTKHKEADTTLSAEERSIGGLGIHLVRQIMDSISYQRTEGRNILTLKKKILTI